MTRAPEPTANFFSDGDHRTYVAARLIRSSTSVGFQPEGDGSQTYALRSVDPQVRFSATAFDLSARHTLRASDYLPRSRCDVDTCHGLVMSLQLILQGESVAGSAVEFNIVVSGYC